MVELEKPISCIKGIGPKITSLMNRINIFTVEDLLMHFPRLYEDRSVMKDIPDLIDGEVCAVSGEVCIVDGGHYTRNGKHVSRIVLKNETGNISGIWFNQRFVIKNFKVGERYLFFGKISILNGVRQIINPEYEKIDGEYLSGITPVYPTTKNLSQKIIRNSIYSLICSHGICIDDILPQYIIDKFNLCEIKTALKDIHFPEQVSYADRAKYRIKFQELLMLQLRLMMEKDRLNNNSGISFNILDDLRKFISSLPFKLTNAQKRCINEILCDMKSNKQMNRLVQGDVGSGKTIVALAALFLACKNGYQGALMAPTEILASQHHQSMLSLFKNWGIRVELLSAKISKKNREEIKDKIKSGEVDIIVGTHAVIQDDVAFNNLGLVITDEQHRFGVRQRTVLSRKGENPDMLVMTATPIPRTMALFIYGDMDISIIDEIPPGRQKVDTYAVKPKVRSRVYDFVRKEVLSGRQAYVVCPLVEDSEAYDLESASSMAEKLEKGYLKGLRVGLLHGRLKTEEKDIIMEKFKVGEIDVLVSTTVVEVGIDIPNASVVVVENAGRFGLAQLHQLRGRVGRGNHKSYCILISEMETEICRKRMEIIRNCDDGFKIAEKDMELRGTGEFFGIKQHGLPELKLADIFKDIDVLKTTNTLAKELVLSGSIYDEQHEILRKKVYESFKEGYGNVSYN